VKKKRAPYPSAAAKEEVFRAFRLDKIEAISMARYRSAEVLPDREHPDGYALVDDGKLIARWRDADVPGLAVWLIQYIHQRDAALFLARGEADRIGRSKKAGELSGEARAEGHWQDATKERKKKTIKREIDMALERREDPYKYVPEWSEKLAVPRTTVRDWVKHYLNKK
jgi:hypothetical protein